jgi:hypothetical protein
LGHSLAVSVSFLCRGLLLLFFPFLSEALNGFRHSLSLFVSLPFFLPQRYLHP